MKKAQILYIKRNCLDDGPGIRTVVFFKGCPLSCAWCHNPESKSAKPELSYDPEKCVGCGDCIENCPSGALSKDNPGFIDRETCDVCFTCADSCPSGALSRIGGEMDIGEVLAVVKKDAPFYRTSGGGVTLSGGEPTLYMEFCSALLRECGSLGINTLIETCGFFGFDEFRRLIYDHLDEIYVDLKLIDPRKHKKYCGVSNEGILENIKKLAALAASGGVPILPRIPLAPGVTATDKNLSGIAEFLRQCGVNKIALLPYNPTWLGKNKMIGKSSVFDESKWMPKDDVERCLSHFTDFELV
jgi:pyruvate formate lyase activating enzyme